MDQRYIPPEIYYVHEQVHFDQDEHRESVFPQNAYGITESPGVYLWESVEMLLHLFQVGERC